MRLLDRDPFGGTRCDIGFSQLRSMREHQLTLPDPQTEESKQLGIMLAAAVEAGYELELIPESLKKTIQATRKIVYGQALDRLDGRYPW